MLRAFAVDRTLVCDAKRTRLPWPYPMSTYLDLQPAVAACRTASAASLSFGLHGLSRACSSVSFELRYTRFQPDPRLTLSPAAKGRTAMPRRTPSGVGSVRVANVAFRDGARVRFFFPSWCLHARYNDPAERSPRYSFLDEICRPMVRERQQYCRFPKHQMS